MSNETLTQTNDTIEIGQDRYLFTQETQEHLTRFYSSEYPKEISVVSIHEPHSASEAQFQLFKGLESFFGSNPELISQTIFLSEGTSANKPISVQGLINEEPHPSDDMIKRVLQTHLITGYMAYEWKYNTGIPIIGTEDEGLYELSRRFASLCLDDPNAVFQHVTLTEDIKFDIPLEDAWDFIVAARNKQMALTLIEQTKQYRNPMLFTHWCHIKDERPQSHLQADDIIKSIMLEVKYLGPLMGPTMFPWSMEGEDWWLYRNVKTDTEMNDIDYYLSQAGIGYTFLKPKGIEKETSEDVKNYRQVFRFQRKL